MPPILQMEKLSPREEKQPAQPLPSPPSTLSPGTFQSWGREGAGWEPHKAELEAEPPLLLTDCPQAPSSLLAGWGLSASVTAWGRGTGESVSPVPPHPRSPPSGILLCRQDGMALGQCPKQRQREAAGAAAKNARNAEPRMQSGCVLPAPLPPPAGGQDIPCEGSPAPPPP